VDTPNRHANNSHAIRQANMSKEQQKKYIVLVEYAHDKKFFYIPEDTNVLRTHKDALEVAKELCDVKTDVYICEVYEKVIAVPATPRVCTFSGEIT
jgi:hypothetical protein